VGAHALDGRDLLDAGRLGRRRPTHRRAGEDGGRPEADADEAIEIELHAGTVSAWAGCPHSRETQIGRTFKKKRASQPIPWASACCPRPRCSMRTLAMCALATLLPGWMARGSTWPEKRSTSTFWL